MVGLCRPRLSRTYWRKGGDARNKYGHDVAQNAVTPRHQIGAKHPRQDNSDERE
jgi:hypothetical protein